jgi:uncharacterized protein
VSQPAAALRCYAELNDFLAPADRGRDCSRPVKPGQTVKDFIEAAGVPHTEIDLVVADGRPVSLDAPVRDGDRLAVYPTFRRLEPPERLQVRPPEARFVLDVHLGGLARRLRLLGFDALYRNDYTDEALTRIATHQQRILATRDTGLLKRAAIRRGCYVRTTRPHEQTLEVLHRFGLFSRVAPFTRCVACNGTLRSVPKAAVAERLEPGTRRHYHRFRACDACEQAYWAGAHFDDLAAFVETVRRAGAGR